MNNWILELKKSMVKNASNDEDIGESQEEYMIAVADSVQCRIATKTEVSHLENVNYNSI